MISAPSTAHSRKIFAKAAGVRTDPTRNAFLTGCFQPFGILTLHAFICWRRPCIDKVYGMRFDPNDPARFRIRGWIDQQLEIV